MPTYVYQCKKCDKTFEIEQRIVEDALTQCLCEEKGAVKRIIQPVGISFKGSGFYVNDSTYAVNPASTPDVPKVEPSTPVATVTEAPSVAPATTEAPVTTIAPADKTTT